MRAASALVVLALAGCAATDPDRRAGMWQPEGANAGNIAAMVERKSDLVRGRTDGTADTRQARDAVERLWDDRQRPFPGRAATATGNGTGAMAQKDRN